MTWSMADNCVIDADLPEAVKAWNENYAYPKLVISGAKGILDAYEKKYSAIIPTIPWRLYRILDQWPWR